MMLFTRLIRWIWVLCGFLISLAFCLSIVIWSQSLLLAAMKCLLVTRRITCGSYILTAHSNRKPEVIYLFLVFPGVPSTMICSGFMSRRLALRIYILLLDSGFFFSGNIWMWRVVILLRRLQIFSWGFPGLSIRIGGTINCGA